MPGHGSLKGGWGGAGVHQHQRFRCVADPPPPPCPVHHGPADGSSHSDGSLHAAPAVALADIRTINRPRRRIF